MSVKKASSSLVSRSRVGFTPTGGGAAVTISNVIVTDSNWNNLDDTAVGTSSSYIKIIGSGFVVNPSVYIGTTQVSSGNITFVSSTELRVVLPSLSLGTQNLFVFNTDYSGAIWSAGLVVSGFPDFTQTTYTSSTPLSVSVQLVATGDAPLTYALQGGSSLPAGTTLSSSGLITGTTTDGTYQFTVIVSDAQNQSFQQQLTLTITSADEYFNRTTLAINGDVNTFVSDASSNNFPVTIVGDTRPSNFSPYNTNWSNFFDGTGDYLTQATNRFLDGSTWTVEGWVYTSDTTATIAAQYVTSGGQFSSRTILGISSGLIYIFQAGSSVSGTTNISNNQWYHIAYVRNGSTVKAYVNGNLETTFSGFINPSLTTTTFFYDGYNSGQEFFGYFSNLRVTTTEVYASSFTPPTSPLTAITGTALLTCQSNRLIDNSTNNFTITKNGDVKVTAFGPFTETDTTTGSTYFDGTGDYLTAPSNTAFTLGSSGDFTIECWFHLIASPSNYAPLMTTWTNSTNSYVNRWGITFYDGKLSWYTDAGNLGVADSSNIALNTWIHVAVVRNGSTITMYKNGVSLGTQTTAQAYTTDNALSIGYIAGGAYITGYISNARIVKGTAVYTSAFTPPTAALTAIANTSLLTLQTRQPVNNHTFIDSSGNNFLIARNGNTSQGSFSPFSPAGWSNYFDTSTGGLTVSSNTALDMGTGDFTIEGWYYPNAADSDFNSTFYLGTINGANALGLAVSNVSIRYRSAGGSDRIVVGSLNLTNSWNHIALVRASSTTKIYLNGTAVGSPLSDSTSYSSSGNLILSRPDSASFRYVGYIANFRIVKGTAVYTSNFTPPSSALTAIANTSLLTCQSNRFIDNSTNNFTITKNGGTAVVNFSPFKPTAAYSPATHGGSAYFDGTGDFLNKTAGQLTLSGNFTIEYWMYPTSTGSYPTTFCNYNYVADANAVYGQFGNNTLTFGFYAGNGSTQSAVGTYTAVLNQWQHHALVRSGTTVTAYVNGVSIGTKTTSVAYDLASLGIGGYTGALAGSYPYFGYISDFRIINGTSLYTSNFTPPAAPVSNNINAVLSLKYNNAAIVDISSRNVMETVGDAKIVTSTKKYGTGSMSFDGTGDYIISRATDSFILPGNFTIEGWTYLNASGNYRLCTVGDSIGASGIEIYVSGGNWTVYSSNAIRITGSAATRQTWIHIAVVRSGSTVTLYVNGTASGSTWSSSSTFSGACYIGAEFYNGSVTADTNGYIDDFRITRFARYTANFTPPTATFLAQ